MSALVPDGVGEIMIGDSCVIFAWQAARTRIIERHTIQKMAFEILGDSFRVDAFIAFSMNYSIIHERKFRRSMHARPDSYSITTH